MGGAYFANDAFLTSRQQVSASLSVPVMELLFRHLPLSLLVAGAYFVARKNRAAIQSQTICLLYFVWLFLSLNQLWGFSQEPYRFAIDAQVPLSIFATAIISSGWRVAVDTRPIKFVAFICFLIVVIPSSMEIRNFWDAREIAGVIQLDSDQYQQMQSVAAEASPGLLLPDPCIEPGILKVVSRHQLAVYSKGLAWPDNVALVKKVVEARVVNLLDLTSAEQLGIKSLLVDNECPSQWATLYSTNLKRITVDSELRFQLFEFRYE